MADKINPAAHDKHAANSRDAGATPVIWGAIVAIAIWFAMEL